MAGQNERLAVVETEVKAIREQLDKMANMQLTMDAVVRQSRKQSELLESDEFIKDRLYVQQLRANAQSNATKARAVGIGLIVSGALTALWLGVIEIIGKAVLK